MSPLKTAILLLAAAVLLPGYTRTTTQLPTTGTPLVRRDSNGIRFQVNDRTAAGMKNSGGADIITADSNPLGALREALAAWNASPGAAVSFAELGTTAASNNGGDGQNVFTFLDTPENRAALGQALAITVYQFDASGAILDSDIIFNPNITLNGTRMPYSTTLAANTIDLASVAGHELGHALGAGHTNIVGATMYHDTPAGTSFKRVLNADDRAFLVDAYPSGAGAYGTIRGTVRSNGAPVRGAAITAHDVERGTLVGALSGLEDGSFVIRGLPAGRYTLYAEPLTGPTVPANYSIPDVRVDTLFRTPAGAGANLFPFLDVQGGVEVVANLNVAAGAAAVRIQMFGTGRAGSNAFRISNSASTVAAGDPIDWIVVGPGIGANTREGDVVLLGPGLRLRPGTLRVDNSVNVGGNPLVRFTVEVGARCVTVPSSVGVRSGDEVAMFTGAAVIEGPAPSFQANAVVNAASFSAGAGVAPGEIASIFGTCVGPDSPTANAGFDPQTGRLPERLGNVEVTFDGVKAPLFYVQNNQLNVQVPYEVAGRSATRVVINSAGRKTQEVVAPVTGARPGLFNVSDVTKPIVVNQDGSLNSGANGAARGSTIVLYGSGGGAVNPPLATGAPATPSGNPLHWAAGAAMRIGGRPATIHFSGMTPGLVGLLQINATVPADAPTGPQVALEATINGVSAQPGMTISVR